MKFSVTQSSFANALEVVSKGLGSSANMPIVSGIYLFAHDGIIELQSTDLTISIKSSCQANVEQEGKTVVSGKILLDIIKTLPDSVVSCELINQTLKLTCEKSKYQLATLNPADFPDFPQPEIEQSIELPCNVLKDMVDRVYKVVSKDVSRAVLGGILITIENNMIRLVATDSYRLAVCDTSLETSGIQDSFEMIIPGQTFHDVMDLAKTASVIKIASTHNQVVFDFDNTTFVSRKIEGNFPNYKQIVPASCDTTVKITMSSLSAALKRVAVVARQNPSIKFEVLPDQQQIILSATSQEQGEAQEVIEDVEIQGQAVTIALNYHYVETCIEALAKEKEVTFELQGEMKPGVFKSYASFNYLYLLMPVRM